MIIFLRKLRTFFKKQIASSTFLPSLLSFVGLWSNYQTFSLHKYKVMSHFVTAAFERKENPLTILRKHFSALQRKASILAMSRKQKWRINTIEKMYSFLSVQHSTFASAILLRKRMESRAKISFSDTLWKQVFGTKHF